MKSNTVKVLLDEKLFEGSKTCSLEELINYFDTQVQLGFDTAKSFTESGGKAFYYIYVLESLLKYFDCRKMAFAYIDMECPVGEYKQFFYELAGMMIVGVCNNNFKDEPLHVIESLRKRVRQGRSKPEQIPEKLKLGNVNMYNSFEEKKLTFNIQKTKSN